MAIPVGERRAKIIQVQKGAGKHLFGGIVWSVVCAAVVAAEIAVVFFSNTDLTVKIMTTCCSFGGCVATGLFAHDEFEEYHDIKTYMRF